LCDGDRIELDFKRYGRRKLVIAIAASEMTITSAKKQSSMLGDTIPGKTGGYTAQDWHQGDWEKQAFAGATKVAASSRPRFTNQPCG
jgi:hypothetical protein